MLILCCALRVGCVPFPAHQECATTARNGCLWLALELLQWPSAAFQDWEGVCLWRQLGDGALVIRNVGIIARRREVVKCGGYPRSTQARL